MSKQPKIVLDELERKTATKIEECYLRITEEVKNLIRECFQSTIKDIENIWLKDKAEMKNVFMDSCFHKNMACQMEDTNKNLIMPKNEFKYETQESSKQCKLLSNDNYMGHIVEETPTIVHKMSKLQMSNCTITSKTEMNNDCKDSSENEGKLIHDSKQMRNIAEQLAINENENVNILNSISTLKNKANRYLDCTKSSPIGNCHKTTTNKQQKVAKLKRRKRNGISKCLLACNVCSYGSKKLKKIKQHLRVVHNYENVNFSYHYQCHRCNYVSPNMLKIKEHMWNCHSETTSIYNLKDPTL